MALNGLNTGEMRPDSALLREFGLPVPREKFEDAQGASEDQAFFGIEKSGTNRENRRMSLLQQSFK